MKQALTFDDVLLVPKMSYCETRSKLNVSVKLNNFEFSHPFIPANMDTVTDTHMMQFIARTKGLSIHHRYEPIEKQIGKLSYIYNSSNNLQNYIGVSVGVKKENKDHVLRFKELGVLIYCIDVAHGHSQLVIDMVNYIRNHVQNSLVIAGNVATKNGAQDLFNAGAHVVKVGIGSSGICTTRMKTGNGVPQFTAIMEAAEAADLSNGYIIADGGIRMPGDACKALCFAHMVMCGNVFAGTSYAPGDGDIVYHNNKQYKAYNGSSTHKKTRVEGVKAFVPYKGETKDVLDNYIESLQSCLSYQGVNNLQELKINPQFIRTTHAGIVETKIHDVVELDI